jgi:hypothetical protein
MPWERECVCVCARAEWQVAMSCGQVACSNRDHAVPAGCIGGACVGPLSARARLGAQLRWYLGFWCEDGYVCEGAPNHARCPVVMVDPIVNSHVGFLSMRAPPMWSIAAVLMAWYGARCRRWLRHGGATTSSSSAGQFLWGRWCGLDPGGSPLLSCAPQWHAGRGSKRDESPPKTISISRVRVCRFWGFYLGFENLGFKIGDFESFFQARVSYFGQFWRIFQVFFIPPFFLLTEPKTGLGLSKNRTQPDWTWGIFTLSEPLSLVTSSQVRLKPDMANPVNSGSLNMGYPKLGCSGKPNPGHLI